MKLKTVAAFEKQLREAAPDHFAKIYLILVSDPYERRFYVNKLFGFIAHYRPGTVFETGEEALEMSLFSQKKVVHLEVERGLKSLPEDIIVIFSGEKCSSAFYQEIENEVVCLDLTGEKPWEKKERLVEEVQKVARQSHKTLTLHVANQLIELIGNDFASLKNEVDKLVLFVGDRKSIEDSDLGKITLSPKEVTAWQIAESMVWKYKGVKRQAMKDLSEILALIALLRHHIYLGIQICRGESPSNLRKNQLEVYLPFCQRMGVHYFIERLLFLFEWELKAKTNSFDPEILWDLLVIHYDTLSAAELTSSRS